MMKNREKLIDLVEDVMLEFGDAAYAKYGSHAFTAGYLESVLKGAIVNMSKRDREMILNDLACTAEKLQKKG